MSEEVALLEPDEVYWRCAGAITEAIQPYDSQPYIQQGLSAAYYAAVALRGNYHINNKTYYDGIVAAYDPFYSIIDELINKYIDRFLRDAIRHIGVGNMQPIKPGTGN